MSKFDYVRRNLEVKNEDDSLSGINVEASGIGRVLKSIAEKEKKEKDVSPLSDNPVCLFSRQLRLKFLSFSPSVTHRQSRLLNPSLQPLLPLNPPLLRLHLHPPLH